MKFLHRLLFFSVLLTHLLFQHAIAGNEPPTYPVSGELRFMENKGQLPKQVLYNAKVPGGDLFLERNTFTYYVFDMGDLKKIHPLKEDPLILHGHAWKETFLGANPNPVIRSISPSSTYYN